MTTVTDLTLPLSRLNWRDDAPVRLADPGALSHEALGALLAHVVRHAVAEAIGSAVEPVSLTLDVSGALAVGTAIDFTTEIDRRTRTLVFANGRAMQGETVVMTLTAVFRIQG